MVQRYLSVPILTFHKVDSAFEWGLTRITPARFDQILYYLQSQGYESVSLDDIFNSPLKLPEKPVAITFDDGYESVYSEAFPIMQKYGFISTTFLITNYMNEYNTWDVNLGGIRFKHLNWRQVGEMQEHGHDFGSHTLSHSDLTRLSDYDLEKELQQSKIIIEDQLNTQINYIAFPFGKYNNRVLDFSLNCGYFKGIGVIPQLFYQSDFVAHRKSVYLGDANWNLNAKLKQSRIEELRLRIINFCSYGTAVVKHKKK